MIKKEKNKSRFIKIGSLLLLIGLCVFAGYHLYNYLSYKEDIKKADDFINQAIDEKINTSTPSEEKKEETQKVEETYNYIGVLEIPTINFKKVFFSINDKYNKVNQNIEVLGNSDMPDITNGIMAIVGHSGTGRVAFFKNLYKLKINDEIIIYYNNVKYIYKVNKNYEVDKNGTITIDRDKDKTTLVLTTCSQSNKKNQIVIISYLVDKENY